MQESSTKPDRSTVLRAGSMSWSSAAKKMVLSVSSPGARLQRIMLRRGERLRVGVFLGAMVRRRLKVWGIDRRVAAQAGRGAKLMLTLVAFCSAGIQSAVGGPRLDFDGDGVSDLTYYEIAGGSIQWSAIGSANGEEVLDVELGTSTDVPAPACWLGPGAPSVGVARLRSPRSVIVWKTLQPDGLISEQQFGRGNDLLVVGADFDGDEVADAATVRIRGKRLLWRVAHNLLAAQRGAVRRIAVGDAGARAFYLNLEGDGDWLATFGRQGRRRAVVTLKNIVSKKKAVIRGIPARLAREPRPRPFPVAQEDSRDAIAFALPDETDTTLEVYSNTGEQIFKVQLPGLGVVFTGDFLADQSGEEIGFQSGNRLVYVNPFTQQVVNAQGAAGTPIGRSSFGVLVGPSPTPAPTATVAPTPTPTVAPTATATRE